MRILLVDDENLARDRLRRLLERDGQHEVVGEAANGVEAVQRCEQLAPELVLLDIRMPGMDGLEAARHFLDLQTPPAVVFCTAYEEHAVQAFDLQAVGYLLKPVRQQDLLAALQKAVRLNRAQLAALQEADDSKRSHISARTHKGVELIPVADVRFFQADQKYVTVRYSRGEVIVDETLRDLELEFPDIFVRVHRNALIATAHLEGLSKSRDGHVAARFRDVEETVDISRRHLPAVRKLIKRL
jgi:two-component system response regulator AlgR